MFDAGPTLVVVLALGLAPAGTPLGEPVEPLPPAGAACVRLLSALYVGGPLEPCPDVARPGGPLSPRVVPLDRPAHSVNEE